MKTILLSVWGTGSTGSGILTIQNGESCQRSCRYEVPENQEITISAAALNGHTFAGWEGDCANTPVTDPCKLIMDSEKSVYAIFKPPAK